MIKHILSGGFIYLMITNAFAWMNAVISSFSRIGAAVTGLPSLSPQTILQLGGQMADTILNTPASTSVMTNLEVAIIQSVCGFVVLPGFKLISLLAEALFCSASVAAASLRRRLKATFHS